MNAYRERLAALEEKVKNIEDDVREMRGKVDEMHAVLLQAKGARWAIVAVAGCAGFLAGFAHRLPALLER
jgi:multidrug resistance efflux pump